MIVEILKTDNNTGVKQGQIYKAQTYGFDPSKITLLQKLTKKDRKPVGKTPVCNEYKCNVKVLTE